MSAPQDPSVLHRALLRITQNPILGVIAWLQAAGMLLVIAAYVASRSDPSTGVDPNTGDFLAFWTGATLVADGHGAELYDFATQSSVQEAILAADHGYFQPYLNPPGLAVALAPSVTLGFVPSFIAFSVAMTLAFLAGAIALRPHLQNLLPKLPHALTALAIALTFQPVIRTMWGGQNTALSLGLATLALGALRSERQVLAGVAVGLLSFKPQLGILIGLALLMWRQWAAATTALGVATLHYLIGAWVAGPDWPVRMLRSLAEFVPREVAATGPFQFSLPRVLHELLPAHVASPIATVASIAVIVCVVALCRVHGPERATALPAWGLVISATMLISPHLVYYDAGLLVLPVVLALEETVRRHGTVPLSTRLLIALGYFSYPAYLLGEAAPLQPLFVVLAAVFAWLAYLTATAEVPT